MPPQHFLIAPNTEFAATSVLESQTGSSSNTLMQMVNSTIISKFLKKIPSTTVKQAAAFGELLTSTSQEPQDHQHSRMPISVYLQQVEDLVRLKA